MEVKQHLEPRLKQLRLSGILETLEARTREAIAGQWSYQECLERLLQDEVERRAQKQLALRVRRAQVNGSKTLDQFDFGFNPSINRQDVLRLASGDYLRQHRNVLICGPTGVGKTHLAQALAHQKRWQRMTCCAPELRRAPGGMSHVPEAGSRGGGMGCEVARWRREASAPSGIDGLPVFVWWKPCLAVSLRLCAAAATRCLALHIISSPVPRRVASYQTVHAPLSSTFLKQGTRARRGART